MNCRYLFNPLFSQIDVCREGYESVFVSNRKSFLWDEAVQGITLKMEVYSEHEASEEKKVRIKLAIVRDGDWRILQESLCRYEYWKHTKEEPSSSFAMDGLSYQHVLELYHQDVRKTWDELSAKIISESVTDYAMPVGKDKDYFQQTIPVDMDKLEVNTSYRICLSVGDDIPDAYQEWPLFMFFRPDLPVEETFVPYAAYLKVREQRDGKLLFDKATHYRHYKDFYGDVHYDKVCMEVEVNPVLVCVELEANGDNEVLPLFTVSISFADKEVWHDDCRLVAIKGTKRIVACCPLSVDMIPFSTYHEFTVSLQVFGRKLTQFSFLTDRTEPGELRLRKV